MVTLHLWLHDDITPVGAWWHYTCGCVVTLHLWVHDDITPVDVVTLHLWVHDDITPLGAWWHYTCGCMMSLHLWVHNNITPVDVWWHDDHHMWMGGCWHDSCMVAYWLDRHVYLMAIYWWVCQYHNMTGVCVCWVRWQLHQWVWLMTWQLWVRGDMTSVYVWVCSDIMAVYVHVWLR